MHGYVDWIKKGHAIGSEHFLMKMLQKTQQQQQHISCGDPANNAASQAEYGRSKRCARPIEMKLTRRIG
jgi:hypothetical protein